MSHQKEKDNPVEASDGEVYSTHRDQFLQAQPPSSRYLELEDALLSAFTTHIVYREVGFIQFGDLSAVELAGAFQSYPILVKSVLALANVATRAVYRDLGFQLNTYTPSLTPERACILAGYLKPLLPQEVAIPAILELDRFWWTDKELRAMKGRWEKKILAALLSFATVNFQKRRFEHNGEDYELDAAYSTADCIKIGVDVKRIESKRDIHKRSDEIINKANHFKSAYPEGLFYVVVYYPFPTQHGNLRSRLDSGNIDGLYMASESDSSIDTAVRFLLDAAGVLRKHSEDEDEY